MSDAAPAVERWLAWRYLATRQREGFVSFIAIFSLIGVALGVATLIVVLSVMGGFRQQQWTVEPRHADAAWSASGEV